MKPTLLYIHGLGSDRNARKFQNLKDYFQDRLIYDFLEWNSQSNIEQLIHQKLKQHINTKVLYIIGDSTGANFAYQLRELRDCKTDKLILTSPLLQIEKLIISVKFPVLILKFIKPITTLNNILIIASKNDEVLDQSHLFYKKNNHKNVQIIEIEDSHRLLNFKKVLPKINDYINDN